MKSVLSLSLSLSLSTSSPLSPSLPITQHHQTWTSATRTLIFVLLTGSASILRELFAVTAKTGESPSTAGFKYALNAYTLETMRIMTQNVHYFLFFLRLRLTSFIQFLFCRLPPFHRPHLFSFFILLLSLKLILSCVFVSSSSLLLLLLFLLLLLLLLWCFAVVVAIFTIVFVDPLYYVSGFISGATTAWT